jgi:predicted RNase H-like HicB family nuclease
MDVQYVVILEPEPDGSAYSVIVPAFPEAHTWGESVEDALANAREVIELCVADRTENGEDIPASDIGKMRLESVTISRTAG